MVKRSSSNSANATARQSSQPQLAALLAKTDAGMPLYLLAGPEELRTLGTYGEITGRVAELPATTHKLFAWIPDRLENDGGLGPNTPNRPGATTKATERPPR